MYLVRCIPAGTDGIIAHEDTTRPTASRDQRSVAGELALDIMHEVRSPLEALSYLNFLALDDVEDVHHVRKYLLLAQEQIAILTAIAKQTLWFARLSAVRRPIDLVAVAEAALRTHRQTIEAKQIHLVRDLPDDLIADCHAGQMLQVVSSLIVNALDSLPEGGKLSMRFCKRHGHIHLIFADNGHGIPDEHQTRIFERFSTTKGEAGNGLGLALSKRIIEEQDGRLSFRTSVRPGRSGTAFKICFPA